MSFCRRETGRSVTKMTEVTVAKAPLKRTRPFKIAAISIRNHSLKKKRKSRQAMD